MTPYTYINTISIIAAAVIGIIGGVAYLMSRLRKSDMELLRANNDDLRKSLDDNTKKVTFMQTEIKTLNDKVNALEKQNKTLEDLVVVALKQYFFENPTVAEGVGKSVAKR